MWLHHAGLNGKWEIQILLSVNFLQGGLSMTVKATITVARVLSKFEIIIWARV